MKVILQPELADKETVLNLEELKAQLRLAANSNCEQYESLSDAEITQRNERQLDLLLWLLHLEKMLGPYGDEQRA